MCGLNVSLTTVFKTLRELTLDYGRPASDKVNLFIGFFLGIYASNFKKDCV